ncbi:uncharacterized protein RHO25_007106 [Cercospora beticola]|nr:hypothetical protein RHO25_007106 [Cercospora beticola]
MAESKGADQDVTSSRLVVAHQVVADQVVTVGQVAAVKDTTEDENKQANYLETLPGELIGIVASHTDILDNAACPIEASIHKKKSTALHALRLTCKALFRGSEDEWNRRHTQNMVVRLAPGAMHAIMSFSWSPKCFARVAKVDFFPPKTAKLQTDFMVGAHATDFGLLLEGFLRKLSCLQSVEVHDMWPPFGIKQGTSPSLEVSLLLRTLETIEPPKLKRIVLGSLVHSTSSIKLFLRAMGQNLRCLSIQEVDICSGTVNPMLACIRDDLQLNELYLGALRHTEANRHVWFLDAGHIASAREHKWFRGTLSRKLERYSIAWRRLEAIGEGAVKLALNRVLQRSESNLYDASMTKESLGF